MRIFITISITILIFLSLSCSTNNKTANVLLHDIWVLESIEGKTYLRAEGQELHPTLEIYLAEERFSGNTGCNNMNGTVKVEGENISFSNIITTKMFCVDVDETSFLSALKKVNNYKIEKMILYLLEDNREFLVFKKID